jgi:hypothetical protein
VSCGLLSSFNTRSSISAFRCPCLSFCRCDGRLWHSVSLLVTIIATAADGLTPDKPGLRLRRVASAKSLSKRIC